MQMVLTKRNGNCVGRRFRFSLATFAAVAAAAALAGCAPRGPSVAGLNRAMPPAAETGAFSGFSACRYKGSKARATDKAQCGTFVVAENRDKPNGRKIALPVVKLPALAPTGLEPIVFVAGGPGLTAFAYDLETPALFQNHDIYMLGFRGVDDLAPLDCPEVAEAMGLPYPLSEAVRRAIGAAAAQCAQRLTSNGIDLSQYGVVDVAHDLEDLRKALRLGRINMISNSYGTRIAQYFTRLYPTSIKRSFLAAANPPGHFFWHPETTDEILRAYSDLCKADRVCSKETDDLAATVLNGLTKVDPKFLTMKADMDRVRIGGFLLMMSRASAVNVFEASFEVEQDDAYSRYLFLSKMFKPLVARGFVWGDMFSKGGVDCALKGPNFIADRLPTQTSMGSPFDLILDPACHHWPWKPAPSGFDRAAIDKTETLIVNGDLDVATPVKYVREELMPFLPNGRLVVLKNFGHEEVLREQTAALDHLASQFFKNGVVDSSRYVDSPVPFPAN